MLLASWSLDVVLVIFVGIYLLKNSIFKDKSESSLKLLSVAALVLLADTVLEYFDWSTYFANGLFIDLTRLASIAISMLLIIVSIVKIARED
jgi:hypothetical protein